MIELYEIATDDRLDLELRYAALKMMQHKKKQQDKEKALYNRLKNDQTKREEKKISMITLTKRQSDVYEAIKSGNRFMTDILKVTDLKRTTAKDYIRALISYGMVESERGGLNNKFCIYTAKDVPHEVKHVKEKVCNSKQRPDHLIDRLINTKITPEQAFYLKHHKRQKRSLLAKRVGLTKLQLNYVLERLG
ncbi:hypothetical protein PN4B1_16770 [Paenibacillus naphthalenovorans]|nr:hypothetical protein PN4B1_16770 [Paenibacillus naphthalenovorans]